MIQRFWIFFVFWSNSKPILAVGFTYIFCLKNNFAAKGMCIVYCSGQNCKCLYGSISIQCLFIAVCTLFKDAIPKAFMSLAVGYDAKMWLYTVQYQCVESTTLPTLQTRKSALVEKDTFFLSKKNSVGRYSYRYIKLACTLICSYAFIYMFFIRYVSTA